MIMNTMMNIHAIFMATEGEGVHIGTPQVFVRFQGCAVGCLNCDSKETWDFTKNEMSLESVMSEIEKLSGSYPHIIKRVSITGGDPLHPKNSSGAESLALALKKNGYFVNIEAAGTRVVDSIFDSIDYISFDVKTPSTGVNVNQVALRKLHLQYGKKSQVKAVIADKKDFEFVYDLYNSLLIELDYKMDTPWVLTPCYEPGEEFPMARFQEIISMNESFGAPFRVICQQHKVIHGPDKRDI